MKDNKKVDIEKSLKETLNKYLEQAGTSHIIVNNEKVYSDEDITEMKSVLADALMQSLEEEEEGDIDGNTSKINMEAYQRFVDANILSLSLFGNLIATKIECRPSLSFASTCVTCENFYFEEDEGHKKFQGNDKERFRQFFELIDFLYVSSGAAPTEIYVTFIINNVWEEQKEISL